MNATATQTTPAAFRRASRVAEAVALEAGELVNSITDGHAVTSQDVRELTSQISKVNNKRRSTVDASTARFFYAAAFAFGRAADALILGNTELAAERLDLGANELDQVPAHIRGLFA